MGVGVGGGGQCGSCYDHGGNLVCIDGGVEGRWNFRVSEEVILELASGWRNRMG